MPHLSVDHHQVRSYELDSYGHVNNAVYMQWLEHGRSRLLQDFGFTYNNIEEKWGVRFVLVATKIDFKVGLVVGDRVRMTTTVVRAGTSSVTFRHEVWRENAGEDARLSASAEATITFTDPAMRGSAPIPPEFRRLYVD